MAMEDPYTAAHAARLQAFAAPQRVVRSLAANTMIRTQGGDTPANALSPGDLVLTVDNGLCPLRRLHRRRIGGRGPATPVLICAGSFGASRDLHLSQDHRILLSDPCTTATFGPAGALAEARHLLNGTTVRLAPCAGVDYIQLVFDRPELIFAEDLMVETACSDPPAGEGPGKALIRPNLSAAELLVLLADILRTAHAPVSAPQSAQNTPALRGSDIDAPDVNAR